TAFPATVYANPPAGGKVSVSRETNVGVRPTIGVGVGPRVLAPKVSESLINNRLGFNRRVPFAGSSGTNQSRCGGVVFGKLLMHLNSHLDIRACLNAFVKVFHG